MKKRGFTLVELLAVIVILAVVAIITIPMLLNVIDEARLNAAKVTATNYIDHLEEQISLKKLKGEEIQDGKYEIIEEGRKLQQSQPTQQTKARSMARTPQVIKMNLKGKLPHKGTIEIKNGRVIYAEFYAGNYKIVYEIDENGKASISISKGGQKKSTIDMSLTPTTKSITATVTCTTEGIENDTYKYKYKIDNGNYIESNSNIHTFNNLKANSKHKITAQCTNSTGGVAETSREITTYEIDEPTYELDTEEEWASKRTVTITYYGKNLKNSYSLDGGTTWVEVEGNSIEIPFTSNGSIIARTTDGENIKTTTTYTVSNIDATGPSDDKPSGSKTTKSITVTSNQKDEESGIKKVEYAIYKENAWSSWQASNVFSELKNDTTYKIKTRAENNAGIKQESKEESVKTLDIPSPTYSITGDTTKKTVTITFANGYTHSYKKDNGSWVSVTGNSVAVEFTASGSIIARSYDGKNYKEASTYTVVVKLYKCKRATSLHTYGSTSIGQLGTKGTLKSGDAFDCDVNGDGVYNSTNERFYYVSGLGGNDTNNIAVLIYYNNVSKGIANNTSNYAYDISGNNHNGPVTAVAQLPTTTQWSNVKLSNTTRTITNDLGGTNNYNGTTLPTAYSYSGYAARLLTAQEVNKACGINAGSSVRGELESCKYLMENTRYFNSSFSLGYWLETPRNSSTYNIWDIHGTNRCVNADKTSYTDVFGVRPVIEVNVSDISY